MDVTASRATPRLLTAREAAEALAVQVETFRRLCIQGDGPPFVVVGHRKRFPEDALAKWIRSRLVTEGG